MVFVQDNGIVITMIIKARAPTRKHVARTHSAVYGRYIHAQLQIADTLTKGNFAGDTCVNLCGVIRVGAPPALRPEDAKPTS